MRQRDIVLLLNDKNVQQAGGFAGCHVRFHTIPQDETTRRYARQRRPDAFQASIEDILSDSQIHPARWQVEQLFGTGL